MSDLPPALERASHDPAKPVPPEPQLPGWLRITPSERRWPAAFAILVAIVIHLTLPNDLAPRPHWVLPSLEVAMLLILLVVNPSRISRESRYLRPLSVGLVGVLGVATAWSAALLVNALFNHGAKGIPPQHLLLWGGAIWVTNIIVFALWFWEGDRGGPAARAEADTPHPDFLFAQMTEPRLARRDWEPTFIDYLYLSFTNATAFSPTDTLPMSTWAKLGMLAESAISLMTVVLVVARAVNVLV